MKRLQKGFSLVELIIVITILAILGTISFISYSNIVLNSKNSARLTDIQTIEKSLNVYMLKNGKFPLPGNNINISISGSLLRYQGVFSEDLSKRLSLKYLPLDPVTLEEYYYSTNPIRDKYEIVAFTDDINYTNTTINKSYAIGDKYGIYRGSTIGYIFDGSGNYLNIDTDLYDNNTYKLFSKGNNAGLNFNGIELSGIIYNNNKSGLVLSEPSSCPDGFIPVPGNINFLQSGFCVAKYEMTFDDYIVSLSTDYNSIYPGYLPDCAYKKNWGDGKQCTSDYFVGLNGGVVSKPGNYIIGNISEHESIKACESIGAHLITNNEWMTIARSIENNEDNWSGGSIGKGVIYNGVSGHTGIGCDNTGGNTETGAYMTKAGPGGNSCDARRELFLENGESIWDFAGNAREHVNKNNYIDGKYYNYGKTYIEGVSSDTGSDDDGVYSKDYMDVFGSQYGYSRNYGMGNIVGGGGLDNNTLMRGGSAYRSINAGIYAAYVTSYDLLITGSTGFRCVY